MPLPFPGMNPYLEHPDLWPQVHQKLIAALADTLTAQLPPKYQARLRERHYEVSGEDSLVVGSPGLDWSRNELPTEHTARSLHAVPGAVSGDMSSAIAPTNTCPSSPRPIPVLIPVPQKIYETSLEIVDTAGETVTVIEALSPKKKRPGRGRAMYERQREAIFGSPIHFVEIDLLRGWEPPSIYGPDEAGDYRILISRSEQRPRAQLYTWTVTEAIPRIVLPLTGPDELPLCLKPVVDRACDRTDLLVNYQNDPLPPLRSRETQWLGQFLQQVGMRPCAS